MAGKAKQERRTVPWDKIQKFCNDGRTIEFMATHLGYVGKDKNDLYKPMRAILSIGRKNGKLSPKAGLQRTAGAAKAKTAKAKKGPKVPKVKATKGKKVASTTKTTGPQVLVIDRSEDGNFIQVKLGSGAVALVPNTEFAEKVTPLLEQISSEAAAQTAASPDVETAPAAPEAPETKQEEAPADQAAA
jgi:hypothetical protein